MTRACAIACVAITCSGCVGNTTDSETNNELGSTNLVGKVFTFAASESFNDTILSPSDSSFSFTVLREEIRGEDTIRIGRYDKPAWSTVETRISYEGFSIFSKEFSRWMLYPSLPSLLGADWSMSNWGTGPWVDTYSLLFEQIDTLVLAGERLVCARLGTTRGSRRTELGTEKWYATTRSTLWVSHKYKMTVKSIDTFFVYNGRILVTDSLIRIH